MASLAGMAATGTKNGVPCAESHPDFGRAPSWRAMAVEEAELVPTIFAIETLDVQGNVEFVTSLADGCYAVVYTVTLPGP